MEKKSKDPLKKIWDEGIFSVPLSDLKPKKKKTKQEREAKKPDDSQANRRDSLSNHSHEATEKETKRPDEGRKTQDTGRTTRADRARPDKVSDRRAI